MKQTTYELLLPIVNSIKKIFYASSIVNNGSGSYTLHTSDTLWLTIGYPITIDDVVYTITDLDTNFSITVTGASLPVLTIFEIYAPKFTHGTILAKNAELVNRNSGFDKYPMIYLHDRTVEKHDDNEESSIERVADCDFYFMVDTKPETWETLDHDRYAIKPMRNLLYAFKTALHESCGIVAPIEESTVIDNANWGEYTENKGNLKKIFPDPLSGSYLKIYIPFYEQCECCTTPTVDTDLLHQYNFCNASVKNRLTEAQIECLTAQLCSLTPAIVTNFAGVPKYTIPNAGTQAIPLFLIKNSSGATVATREFDEGYTLAAELPRIYAWPEPSGAIVSHQAGDDKWIQDLYFSNLPTGIKPILASFFLLVENNSFGNKNRFTDTLGGQVYANNVMVDNYRGVAWYRARQANTNISNGITTALNSNAAGLSGWFLPSIAIGLTAAWYGGVENFGNVYSYPQFGIDPTDTNAFWTSTSQEYSPDYKIYGNSDGRFQAANGGNQGYFLCRKHF